MAKRPMSRSDRSQAVSVNHDSHATIPSLFFCALAAIEIYLYTRSYWYIDGARDLHTILVWIALGSFLPLAVLAFWKRPRDWMVARLEETGRLGPVRHRILLGATFCGIFSLLLFLKLCQYRSFQFPMDTAATTNIVFNFLHYRTFECSVLGTSNYLGVHFMPALALLAPLLMIWNNVLALIGFQTAMVASIPIAVYFLVYRRTESSLAAWSALWIALTCPFLLRIAGASVALQVIGPSLFLWGIYFLEMEFWIAGGAFIFLLLLLTEVTPLLFFGMGLYLILKLGPRTKRAWSTGLGICAIAIFLEFLEIRLLRSFPESGAFGNLGLMSHFGSNSEAVTVGSLALRALHLRPTLDLLLSTGLTSFLAPVEMIPWVVNYSPTLLTDPQSELHNMTLHYSAYILGPLFWAMAVGLSNLHKRLSAKGLMGLTLAWAILVGACNLYRSPAWFSTPWPHQWFDELPLLASQIPGDASVWAVEYATPQLACRRFLKAIPQGDDLMFGRGLFVPDYVLMGRVPDNLTKPEFRVRMLTFLAREGYVKVGEFNVFVLLKNPRAPLTPPGGRPPPTELPLPGPQAGAYANYLLQTTAPGQSANPPEQEDALSDYKLAVSYFEGSGVPKDLPKALKLFRKAAEHGNAAAQHNLGVFLSQGIGVPKNLPEAMKWFRKAAEQGEPNSQYILGMSLINGEAGRRDMTEARKWFSRASANGSVEAKEALKKIGDQ